MTHIELRTRIGPDGILTLGVPVGMSEANREVKVIVEPAKQTIQKTEEMTSQEWARFVDQTSGAWKGDLEHRANSKSGTSCRDRSPRYECLDQLLAAKERRLGAEISANWSREHSRLLRRAG
jgi:hypothetical protein